MRIPLNLNLLKAILWQFSSLSSFWEIYKTFHVFFEVKMSNFSSFTMEIIFSPHPLNPNENKREILHE